jgi:hypothetical protein
MSTLLGVFSPYLAAIMPQSMENYENTAESAKEIHK